MSKQTAVDWLVEQLYPSIALQSKYIEELKQRAKQKEKEQITDAFYSGYEDRDLFKHSDDYYNKMYERINWQGILYLGEVDGVKIYYDSYHPDQTLTVELNKDKTEMVYIISPYDDITVFDGIKKNIIVSEKPTNMIKPIPELQDPYSPTAKWITTQ
jgi:hypothetical protein